jgi:hypothetical protein
MMKMLRPFVLLAFLPVSAVMAQVAPASWIPVGTASVSDLSANANGDLWAIALDPRTSADKPVLKWNGKEFVAQSVAAKRIAVDPQGNPWIVTGAGALSHWNSKWEPASLKAMDVAVGANGAVWAIGTDSRISQLVDGNWKAVSGAAVRIAVDPRGNPWVVNAGNQIWRWVGNNWQLLPGSAQDIAISADGSVFIVSTKTFTGGWEIQQWNGTGWNAIPGAGGAVIAAGKQLYIALHGAQGSLVYFTTYQPTGDPTTAPVSSQPVTLSATTIDLSGTTPKTGSVTIAPPPPITISTPVIVAPPPAPTSVPATNPPTSGSTVITLSPTGQSIPVTGTLTPSNPPAAPSSPEIVVRGGVMQPLATPIPGTLICPIIEGGSRLRLGCALYGDRAKYVGKAPSASCPDGSFGDPQNGGECWTCPSGYIRNVSPISAKDACWKPIGETLAKATQVGKIGCNNGFFFDPRNGGECWSCPAGYNRTLDPVTADRACSQTIFGPFSKASFGGKNVASCQSGSFSDPINGGTCWTCPAYYRRTLNSVTSDGACAQTQETKYSEATQKSGCSMYPAPVGYGTPFRDPRNGGECWSCPVPLLRSAAPVNSNETGNGGACHAGGNTDRLVWQSPQFPEPGLPRFMPGLLQMALADPKAVDAFLSVRAGNDPAKKRALWASMIADPASSAELKALMFASLLTAAENPNASIVAKGSVREFEEYARARRTFVAQEAVRMFDNWQQIDGYNMVQEARRASGIMGISSSVLGSAGSDYQEYAWTAAAPDSAGLEFVVASAALSTLSTTLPTSTFNNNNPSFQLMYLQPVSFALGNAIEKLAEKGGEQMSKASGFAKIAGGMKVLGANAFFVALTLVNAGIEIGTGIETLLDKDKAAAQYASLVTEAQQPVSVKAMLDSKDEADQRALMLFWSLATSPYSANPKLSQGQISSSALCNSDEWTKEECTQAKAMVTAAAKAAGY